MKTHLYFSHLGLLLVGVLIGWKFSSDERARADAFRSADTAPRNLATNAHTETNRSSQLTPVRSSGTPLSPAQLSNSRIAALRWANQYGGGFSMVHVFDPSGKLTPEFVTLFNLSPEQARELQDKVVHARDQLAQQSISLARTEIDPSNANHLTIDIPPFPAKGTDVYKDVLRSVISSIGSEHADDFNALCGLAFDSSFNEFGANSQKFDISAETVNGETLYAINRSFEGPSGSGTTQDRLSPAEVPKYLPLVEKLIPPTFGKTPPVPKTQ